MKKFTKENLQSTIHTTNELLRIKGYKVSYEIGYKAIKETITISETAKENKVHFVNGGVIKELVIFAWGLQAIAVALPVLIKERRKK